MRVIITDGFRPLDLAQSKCTRYIMNGGLFEVVKFHGNPDVLSSQELGRFVDSFPMEKSDAYGGFPRKRRFKNS
jgi:hypothetical protein